MGQWHSKVFVFKDERGQEYITSSLAVLFEKSNIRVFEASGPFMPIGYPRPALISDVSEWMIKLQQAGFKFEPSSVE